MPMMGEEEEQLFKVCVLVCVCTCRIVKNGGCLLQQITHTDGFHDHEVDDSHSPPLPSDVYLAGALAPSN